MVNGCDLMSPQTIMILYVLIRIYVYIYMRTCTVCTRTDINMVTVLPIEITSGLQLQPLLLCLERKRRRHPNQPTFEHFASISYISYTCMSYIYILYIVIIMYIMYIYIVHKHGSLARHPKVGFGKPNIRKMASHASLQ